MEEIMTKKQTVSNPFSSSQPLGIHRDSQTISKTKPKIRIIHIFAPEIIKTDVANFRELVQRLTGKPTETGHCKKKPRVPIREEHSSTSALSDKPLMTTTKKIDLIKTGYRPNLDAKDQRSVKEEERMTWNIGENVSSGGFLDRFADLEGFIQELGGEFPLFPLDTSHMQYGFEGVHQLV
ncbi:hypothetical protein FNV43_RR16557 [Rhamnella rubrinervis]|uniref:VQ domain-containing protein n=1 Tax=Rhamnella rubrinervis TaxID=2594499 RepID=A0A8K0MDE6_9ROSA|nr:hypothetical protein FNV43_RR16557 [Rhamnella rubrinervis]